MTDSPSPIAPPPRPAWLWWLLGCLAVSVVLVGIGDKYPFSPFPMYSNVAPEVDVLYVADQDDKPLPISSLFDVGSAQAKKRFENVLKSVAGTRDYENARPEQVKQAGEQFLRGLWGEQRDDKAKKAGVRQLKARIITVSVADTGGFRRVEHPLAEISVE